MEVSMKYYMITGASSGIGRETAIQLSSESSTILLVARRRDNLLKVKDMLKGPGIVMPCDLTDPKEIESVFEALKNQNIKLDGLIYCAGICFTKTIKMMQSGDLENMFRINVFGFYEVCRHFQKVKISNAGAAIVGVSSYAAILKESGMSAYAMSKEAMNVQVQVLSKEFAKRKIRINTIMPANVMSKMDCENNDWSEEELRIVNSKQPFGIIPIENIVEIIKFLLSDTARFITGETLSVSAGY
jgi:Dehydrogenases with different specificities (related to short-chain alcohol dehydrogenases)